MQEFLGGLDQARGYLMAIALAFAGRALKVAAMRPAISAALLWEIPTCLGMGIIGSGAAEYMDLRGHMAGAMIAGLSYIGPAFINTIAAALLKKVG